MKPWLAIAYLVAASLVGAGLVFLAIRSPRGQPVELRPPPTPAPLEIHVTGAVQTPGVYTLPPGSRVEDALLAASGLLAEASTEGLNLAKALVDGEQVYVAFSAETPAADRASQPGGQPDRSSSLALVNINTASQAELESLPEIGPETARKIIEYRTANGFFETIQDIQEVYGIGPATFEQIQTLITVGEVR